MADGGTVWIWTAAILAGAIGFTVGYLLAHLGSRDPESARLKERLAQQQEEFAAYRNRVDDHFVATSELFQDMTRQYGALYEHLASGAQSLCSDRLVTHRPQVPESAPMVEHKRAETARAQSPDAASAAETPAPAVEPESELQTRPEPTPTAAQPEKAAAAVEEVELEGFAPRPEAAHLRASSSPAAEVPAPSVAEEESKRRLH